MEIFRTDGGGKTFADERLFKLVSLVESYTHEGFLNNVKIINDHKGTLNISLKDDLEISKIDLEYIYSVFLTFWHFLNDYLVSIYYKETCLIGFNLNGKI